jgi:hypothetical protein
MAALRAPLASDLLTITLVRLTAQGLRSITACATAEL